MNSIGTMFVVSAVFGLFFGAMHGTLVQALGWWFVPLNAARTISSVYVAVYCFWSLRGQTLQAQQQGQRLTLYELSLELLEKFCLVTALSVVAGWGNLQAILLLAAINVTLLTGAIGLVAFLYARYPQREADLS